VKDAVKTRKENLIGIVIGRHARQTIENLNRKLSIHQIKRFIIIRIAETRVRKKTNASNALKRIHLLIK